jgi:hypothetical protein
MKQLVPPNSINSQELRGAVVPKTVRLKPLYLDPGPEMCSTIVSMPPVGILPLMVPTKHFFFGYKMKEGLNLVGVFPDRSGKQKKI